jgi:integrase
MKLGTTEQIETASAARKLAQITLGKIASGNDPLKERKAEKQRERSRLDDLLDRYDGDLQRRGYVNYKVVTNGLRTKMKPLLARDIQSITGAELATIIEGLEKKGRHGSAQDFRSRCRAFLTWCVVKAKVIEANPLAGYRKERATRADRLAKQVRAKALNDDQLSKVWKAADPDTAFGRLMRFYILTGCRRGEGAGLTWSMVDRRGKVINLPASFVKQGRGHTVPIAPALDELLEACPTDARSDLVFASPRTGGRMSGFTQLHSKCVQAAETDFLIHDLRRTFRTGLSRLRVSTEIAELALGHARGDLEAIYNKDEAREELRHAFELWADHVTRVAGPILPEAFSSGMMLTA